jgi:hypothetical protein
MSKSDWNDYNAKGLENIHHLINKPITNTKTIHGVIVYLLPKAILAKNQHIKSIAF